MSWIPPVYDRSASDVSYAIQHPDDASDLKGAYNASDLNRVNNNMLYIQQTLHSMGYTIVLLSTDKTWSVSDIPTISDFEDYLADVAMCRDKLSVFATTPSVPGYTEFDYKKANGIEKILCDIEELIRNIQTIYLYSDDIYCGEVQK